MQIQPMQSTQRSRNEYQAIGLDTAVKSLKSSARKRDWYLNDDARVTTDAHLLFYLAPLKSMDFAEVTQGGKVAYRAKPTPESTLVIVTKAGMVYLFELKYGVSSHDRDIYLTVIIEQVHQGLEKDKAEQWFNAQLRKMRN